MEKMTDKKVATYLCYYDLRNLDGVVQFKDNPEDYGYDKEEFNKYGAYPKSDCGCDNCFYGREKLARYILALHEHLKQ